MKINLSNNSTDQQDNVRFMVDIVKELLEDYKIPFNNDSLYYFAKDEGASFLCEWMKSKKGLIAKPFKFGSPDQLIAFGFDFEENKNLTSELLKK